MNNEQKIQEVLNQLNTTGYYKGNIINLLDSDGINNFNKVSEFFDQMLNNPTIQYRLEAIKQGINTTNKDKFYEITHYDHLDRGLNLSDGGLFDLYLNDFFTELATRFLEIDPLIYNALFWIHGQQSLDRSGSQNWHRDPEDIKIMKIFIYYCDVTEKNGALQYVPYSYCGGDFVLNKGKNNYSEYQTGRLNQEDSDICTQNAVTFEGTVGDIIITNNTGFHRGGFVREGFRCMSHALYMRPDAVTVLDGRLGNINYDPKVNYIDPTSDSYKNLNKKQKYIKIY
jgi:hypothetical protein